MTRGTVIDMDKSRIEEIVKLLCISHIYLKEFVITILPTKISCLVKWLSGKNRREIVPVVPFLSMYIQ